jgi:hypothetical protein
MSMFGPLMATAIGFADSSRRPGGELISGPEGESFGTGGKTIVSPGRSGRVQASCLCRPGTSRNTINQLAPGAWAMVFASAPQMLMRCPTMSFEISLPTNWLMFVSSPWECDMVLRDPGDRNSSASTGKNGVMSLTSKMMFMVAWVVGASTRGLWIDGPSRLGALSPMQASETLSDTDETSRKSGESLQADLAIALSQAPSLGPLGTSTNRDNVEAVEGAMPTAGCTGRMAR